MAADYYVVSCDRFGQSPMGHPEANFVSRIREELNAEGGGFEFTVPVNDPNYMAGLRALSREVQVYRGNASAPYAWGLIANRDPDEKDNKRGLIEVVNLFEYFRGLHFGKANRTNWLGNGDFSSPSLAPWTPVGITANRVTEWGTRPGETFQLNLYQAGDGLDTFVTQTVLLPGGTYWTLSADFHLRTDNTFVSPSLDNRGLFIERLGEDNATVEDAQFYAITGDTPRGTFEHASVGIHTPPGRNWFVRVRLYSPLITNATPDPGRVPGGIIWANVRLNAMESHSFQMQDLGSVVNAIVQHSQDPAYGKADLNIGAGSPNAGFNVTRVYQHADHDEIAEALLQLKEEGLCDVGFEYLSPTQRIFRIYAPTRGVFRSNLVLSPGRGGTLREQPQLREDGRAAISAALVLSDKSSGPDRSEAAAIDASGLGGVVREKVFTSSEHFDRLPLVAREYLRAGSKVPQVLEAVASSELIGQIAVGDSVPLDSGPPLGLDAIYRIVAIETDTRTDLLHLELNSV